MAKYNCQFIAEKPFIKQLQVCDNNPNIVSFNSDI